MKERRPRPGFPGPAVLGTLALLALTAAGAGSAGAEDSPDTGAAAGTARAAGSAGASAPRFAWYAQATYVEQETGGFRAPYAGTNSLSPDIGRETTGLTLYLGARPWDGAEFWIDPEVDQGYGLDNTLGLAGFPSGEAYKIGSDQPYLRLQRVFVRQTLDFGGAMSAAAAGPNQFAILQSANRLVLTVGKISVVDIFDTNRYAHDPSGDFLNWAVIDAGTFDYAADAWGYTAGAAAEWYVGDWALRGGFFDLSDIPNSPVLEPGFHEYQLDAELEHRHTLLGAPGKLDVTLFENHARMARLEDAIAYAAANGLPVEPAPVRSFRKRDGVSLNFEQQLSGELGMFVRLGDAGGNVETYEFTDIDYTASVGFSLAGSTWHRPGDTVGVARVTNAISKDTQQYLAAGGLGVLVGDGELPHPGHEDIIETYYNLALMVALHVTLDYQWVENPAYNRDRGPVSIIAVRLHAQF
ncbi:MAG TPA: carbohydrate porin [Steroidobacteraceae bacterium]|nr:carbohydrate porin [Steroidobacteraceae bacterium]